MRLHSLSLTAFGSFPGHERVDFDALTSAGLFLVHGPTGAGKTTVLDAVCYALYGSVPGQRDSARSLRCDHAPPDRGPVVVLEATLRGRRVRITRSPAWMRPKLRATKTGGGLVEEKAKVLVEELVGGRWIGRSRRADEAGHLLGDLLGMSADQFAQVAMLPQGEFARFLRATGDDRRELLRRLFSVRIFSDAEQWLADHRTTTHRTEQELRARVDTILDRIDEAAGPEIHRPTDPGEQPLAARLPPEDQALPPSPRDDDASPPGGHRPPDETARPAPGEQAAEEPSPGGGATPAGSAGGRGPSGEAALPDRADDPVGWADVLRSRAEVALDDAVTARAGGEARLRAARALLDEGRALAGRQRRHAGAVARRDRLAEAGAERDRLRGLLDQAARADRVLPLARAATQRAEAATKAVTLAAEALTRAVPSRGDPGPGVSGRVVPTGGDPGPGVLGRVVLSHGDPGPEGLARMERERRDEIAALGELRAEEQRLTAITTEREGLARELAGLAVEERELAGRLGELPALRAENVKELEAARLAAARLPGAEAAHRQAADLLAAVEHRDALAAELAADRHLPERLAETLAALAAARAAAARVPEAQALLRHAQTRLDAARRRDAFDDELAEAEEARRAAVDRAQELRDLLQEARQARIDGMAAELAGGLTPGEPCAVCGSPDHPSPASPTGPAVDAAAEQEAQARFAAADEDRQTAEAAVAALAVRRDEASAQAEDLTSDEAERALSVAEEELSALREAADPLPLLEAEETRLREAEHLRAERRARHSGLVADVTRLAAHVTAAHAASAQVAVGVEWARECAERAAVAVERLRGVAGREQEFAAAVARVEQELAALTGRAEEVRERLVTGRARVGELEADAERLAGRLAGARGGDPTIAARVERLSEEAELFAEAAEAARAAGAAVGEREAAQAEARAAAVEAGFADLAAAEAAELGAAERAAMAGRLREFDGEEAAVALLLADPELIEAAGLAAPDLAALEAGCRDAEAAYEAFVGAADRAARRLDRLTDLRAELAEAWARWRPARERFDLARRMAELTGGTSADNPLHIRLSSFVLGERLRQVADMANERLDHMSGGRYLLRHDQRRSAGDRRRSGGGLGLRVLDNWTGVDRDPATLSGGESFVTSLALALGLADVVTAEAGGVEIGTLFVDEGFGTLDEDTLDGVLDILDGLRTGGRAVGIVSHVPELRTRILAQLHVIKGRDGSTLRVRV